MPGHRRATLSIALLVIAGCVSPEVTARADPELLQASGSAPDADTLSLALSARQKTLFRMLASEDRTGVAELVDYGFALLSYRVDSAGRRWYTGNTTSAYFGLLSGELRPASSVQPTSYRVRLITRGAASVTAYSRDSSLAVYTTWVLQKDGWRATTMSQDYFQDHPTMRAKVTDQTFLQSQRFRVVR